MNKDQKFLPDILPYKKDFPKYLSDYCCQITAAIRDKKHHDYRRHLFINFLRLGFDIDPTEVEIEKKVKVAEIKGRMDAFFKATIFEFKTDLEKERPVAMLELKKYFESQSNPYDYLAILTDGLNFEVYQYKSRQIEQISEFSLTIDNPLLSFRYLDQFIFTSNKITPNAEDIVQRFGLHSPVFNTCYQILKDLFNSLKNENSVQIKFKEWDILLARVYGSKLKDEDLFIKHTYLTIFARLLIAKSIFPEEFQSSKDYRGILTGDFFKKKNLSNLIELDFFSWGLDTSEENNFIGLLAKLESYCDIYDLSNIKEDILKELYQEMIDPESRHDLGEYYTPDWLAELTLREIEYKNGRILDPACGSGTFLFRAIKLIQENETSKEIQLKEILESIIGIDVHPVAVIMTKANIVLALKDKIKRCNEDIYLQVYLADTLIAEDIKKKCLSIPAAESNFFFIPLSTIKRDIDFNLLIDKLASYAHNSAEGANPEDAFLGLKKTIMKQFSNEEIFYWKHNFKLMITLYKQKRNSIWCYILKNAYKPVFLKHNKVDYVVGNPPWLSYRYIKDANYKSRIKELTFELKLLSTKDTKLFTHMDTSTVFFRYCEKEFLNPKGIIAFVMPKTTILPSKQHFSFQREGISQIFDLTQVDPLFNVRTAILINKKGENKTTNIPIVFLSGKLKRKNLELKEANKFLASRRDKFQFLESEINSPYYYKNFFQGATLVPRCFWFVQPTLKAAQNKEAPFLQTSDEAKKEAKKPWKIFLQGRIEKDFLYETVLAKGLLPFSIYRKELIFLPILNLKGSIVIVSSDRLLSEGKEYAAKWAQQTEKLWEKYRSSKERNIYQWLNYNNKLINQDITAKTILLYNTSGTNLTASLLFPEKEQNGFTINGFIAEAVTYYYYPKCIEEGDYLCSILNSKTVNTLIKKYQPEGLFGTRHIHRRPFEVCPIPIFDKNDPNHMQLSILGKECRLKMEKMKNQLKGPVGRMRLQARKILQPQLAKIDKLVTLMFYKEEQESDAILQNDDKAIKIDFNEK